MDEFAAIKPGMARWQIEQRFELDGGTQFREETRYIYPKCKYVTIKVDLKFKQDGPNTETGFSRNDTVMEVSKPYLAYPAKD